MARARVMCSCNKTMANSEAWATECASRNWTRILLTGPEFETFLAADVERITATLKEIGLA
jgi:tripartite-type tricarboxylate transporter receptor subunit TctC